MEQETISYKAGSIYEIIKDTPIASLITFKGDDMKMKYRIFACDSGLEAFYFLVCKDEDGIIETADYSLCTISIIPTNRAKSEYMEIKIMGNITMLTEFSDAMVQKGFKLLAERSKFAKKLYESGSIGNYVILKIVPNKISLRDYNNITKNQEITAGVKDL